MLDFRAYGICKESKFAMERSTEYVLSQKIEFAQSAITLANDSLMKFNEVLMSRSKGHYIVFKNDKITNDLTLDCK